LTVVERSRNQLDGVAELKPAFVVNVEQGVLFGEVTRLVVGILDHGGQNEIDADRLAAGIQHDRLAVWRRRFQNRQRASNPGAPKCRGSYP
jgi:hypothetical protein